MPDDCQDQDPENPDGKDDFDLAFGQSFQGGGPWCRRWPRVNSDRLDACLHEILDHEIGMSLGAAKRQGTLPRPFPILLEGVLRSLSRGDRFGEFAHRTSRAQGRGHDR